MNHFLFPALILVFFSCTTKEDKPLDSTTGLTGTYAMTYMNWDGDVARMPEPGFAGSITLTKADPTHLSMTFTVNVQGEGELVNQSSDPQLIELKPGSGASFSLYDGTVKIGSISPTTVAIKTTTESGDGRVEIRAAR
jgi:hypothetical protein